MNLRLLCLCALVSSIPMACSQLDGAADAMVSDRCRTCHEVPPQSAVHVTHVQARGMQCDVCHRGYGNGMQGTVDSLHDNGVVDVVFRTDTLPLSADSSLRPSYDGGTCTQVYCHGNFPGTQPISVSVTDSATGCGFCHDTASMYAVGHPVRNQVPYHPPELYGVIRNCTNCHPGYSIKYATIVDSTHIDGRVQSGNCAMCH